jgi:hypothetical protein
VCSWSKTGFRLTCEHGSGRRQECRNMARPDFRNPGSMKRADLQQRSMTSKLNQRVSLYMRTKQIRTKPEQRVIINFPSSVQACARRGILLLVFLVQKSQTPRFKVAPSWLLLEFLFSPF